ncbi:GNAT family N-acetyltransferase [Streptomyces nitrosporeus]|uniref:GNAT family N-acetyltransferase n=1 Tax=Streptomyces nitrosporeus TaxID=28894 RepID=UPI0039A18215
MRVTAVDGQGVSAYIEGIREVYADAFSGPPWNEDPSAAGRYAERLAADAVRPGFIGAVAVALGASGPGRTGGPGGTGEPGRTDGPDAADGPGGTGEPGGEREPGGQGEPGGENRAAWESGPGGGVCGFATAWTTPAPFPDDRSYADVAAALGPDRVAAWLCGALEIDELAVASWARGTGTGFALLAAVTEAAPDGRCWLLTSLRAKDAVRFYRRAGWYQVPVDVPGRGALAVFLGPDHPAVPAPGAYGAE